MRFQVVVFDMDGTLLNSKKEISDNSVSAIKALKDSGCSVILNSDRRLSGLADYARQLHLGETDYLICRNGLYIYTGDGSLIAKQGFLNVSDIREIGVYSKDERVSFFTESLDYSCSFRAKNWGIRKRIKAMFRRKERRQELLSPQNRKKSLSADELSLLGNIEIEKARLHCRDIASLEEKYSVYRVADNPGMSDVFTKKTNKYLALLQLHEAGLIPIMDNVVYFGDDTNDMECFKSLKFCVAMGNARPEIKKLAWMVTEDCDHDGIANAIFDF